MLYSSIHCIEKQPVHFIIMVINWCTWKQISQPHWLEGAICQGYIVGCPCRVQTCNLIGCRDRGCILTHMPTTNTQIWHLNNKRHKHFLHFINWAFNKLSLWNPWQKWHQQGNLIVFSVFTVMFMHLNSYSIFCLEH